MAYLAPMPLDGLTEDTRQAAALLDEVAAEFALTGGDSRYLAQAMREALMGWSEIAPLLVRGGRCLEVGAGTGLLSHLVARHGLKVDAIEPLGAGFESFAALLALVERLNPLNLTIIRSAIEDFAVEGAYDLAFSINVMEHVTDWQAAIRAIVRSLKPDGVAVIACPNYDFPFEPHFGLPVLGSKAITARIFRRRIAAHEARRGAQGLWSSLNFIGARQVRRFCQAQGYALSFDKGIMERMLARVLHDPEFRKRHPMLAPLIRTTVQSKAARAATLLPLLFQPYMLFMIRPRSATDGVPLPRPNAASVRSAS